MGRYFIAVLWCSATKIDQTSPRNPCCKKEAYKIVLSKKTKHGKRASSSRETIVMKDKSAISQSLKHLDEGNLTFPRVELISLLLSVDNEVREFTNDNNLMEYSSKFLRMCHNSVVNNERLKMNFRILVGSLLLGVKCAKETTVADGIYPTDFSFKLIAVRIIILFDVPASFRLNKHFWY